MSVITANLNILTVEVLTFYGTIGWVHKMIWFNKNKILVCFEVLYVADMYRTYIFRTTQNENIGTLYTWFTTSLQLYFILCGWLTGYLLNSNLTTREGKKYEHV